MSSGGRSSKTEASPQAGGEHTLYRTPAGRLFSAGACGLGWCRHLSPTPSLFRLRRVPALSEPVRLFHAGYYHNLAVGAASGKLYSWGCGTFCDGGCDGVIPALGRGVDAEDVGGPPQVVPLPHEGGDDPIVDVAGGAYHSAILLRSNQILTFGAGQLGQLARPPRHVDKSNLPVDADPMPAEGVPPTETVVGVGGGFYNTFAKCQSGRLYCSGENQNRQCGDGPANLHQLSHVREVKDVVGVSGGYCHTLVRTLQGVVYSLGCGDDGQRGDGMLEVDEDDDGKTAKRPVVSRVPLPNVGRAIAVAAGANHSVVLSDDGAAYTFGANDVGQCGVPNALNGSGIVASNNEEDNDDEPPAAIAVPTKVPLPPNAGKVVEISVGYAHTVIRTEKDKLFVFGQNNNGQLGLGLGGHPESSARGSGDTSSVRKDGKDVEDPALEPIEIAVDFDNR